VAWKSGVPPQVSFITSARAATGHREVRKKRWADGAFGKVWVIRKVLFLSPFASPPLSVASVMLSRVSADLAFFPLAGVAFC